MLFKVICFIGWIESMVIDVGGKKFIKSVLKDMYFNEYR